MLWRAIVFCLAVYAIGVFCVPGVHVGYTDSPYVPQPRCPGESRYLDRPVDPFDPTSERRPVKCLPHQTGLCFTEIERQLSEAINVEFLNDTKSVCCWYNKVDYFCCLNLDEEVAKCPDYLNKTVVVRKPFHFFGGPDYDLYGDKPLPNSQRPGQGYIRRKRDNNDINAAIDTTSLSDSSSSEEASNEQQQPQAPPKIRHQGRGVGGVAASPRRPAWKRKVDKILKNIKVLN